MIHDTEIAQFGQLESLTGNKSSDIEDIKTLIMDKNHRIPTQRVAQPPDLECLTSGPALAEKHEWGSPGPVTVVAFSKGVNSNDTAPQAVAFGGDFNQINIRYLDRSHMDQDIVVRLPPNPQLKVTALALYPIIRGRGKQSGPEWLLFVGTNFVSSQNSSVFMYELPLPDQTETAASILHEHWRKTHRMQRRSAEDPDPARWKPIDPGEYGQWYNASRHEHMVKQEEIDGGIQMSVNINSNYVDLPPSRQEENYLAAAFVLQILEQKPGRSLDYYGNLVHEEWLRRQKDQSGNLASWVIEAGLDVPYYQLVEEEKEKDRLQVKLCQKTLGAATHFYYPGNVAALSLSPDGKFLAVGGSWNIENAVSLPTPRRAVSALYAVTKEDGTNIQDGIGWSQPYRFLNGRSAYLQMPTRIFLAEGVIHSVSLAQRYEQLVALASGDVKVWIPEVRNIDKRPQDISCYATVIKDSDMFREDICRVRLEPWIQDTMDNLPDLIPVFKTSEDSEIKFLDESFGSNISISELRFDMIEMRKTCEEAVSLKGSDQSRSIYWRSGALIRITFVRA